MIRQKRQIKDYPNRSVLQDLVMRNGPATADSYTPFDGKMKERDNQFKGALSSKFREVDFLEVNEDFDFNPERKPKVIPATLFEKAKEIPRQFLEEFMEDGVEDPEVLEWFRQACIAYKIRRDSKLHEDTKNTYKAVVFYGDDDSVFDKRLSQMAEELDITDDDYFEAEKKLPFLIKALWSWSRHYKANLFTFIQAYFQIESKDGVVRIQNFRDYPTYALDVHGKEMRRFDHTEDVKTKKYTDVIDIFRHPHEHEDIIRLILQFKRCCDLLDIDLTKQNMRIFTNEFVQNIACTYLPDIDEYLDYYGQVDAEVSYALKATNINSLKKRDIYTLHETQSAGISCEDVEEVLGLNFDTVKYAMTEEYLPNKKLLDIFRGTQSDAVATINAYLIATGSDPMPESIIPEVLDMSRGYLVYFKDGGLFREETGIFGSFDSATLYDIYFTITGAIVAANSYTKRIAAIPNYEALVALREKANDNNYRLTWIDL